MFDAIAAAVDWSAVYLALAQVAILLAGLWVALRGAKAILRFVLSSDDRGGGWDYSQGDPDWQTEQQLASDGYWDGYTAANVEFLQAQSAGSTGTGLDPLDPDSPEYIPEYDDGPSGDAWEYAQADAESSADWVPPPLTDDEEEANKREAIA